MWKLNREKSETNITLVAPDYLSSGRMTKKSIWVARVEPFCYHSFTSPTLCRPRPTVSGIAIGESCRNGQKLLKKNSKLPIIIWWKLSRAFFSEINQLLRICSSTSPLLKTLPKAQRAKGLVHITSSNTNLDQISNSESRPSINFKITTKHRPLHKT